MLYALLALVLLFLLLAPSSLLERLSPPLPRAVVLLLTDEGYWPLPGQGWSTAHAPPPLHRALSRWFP